MFIIFKLFTVDLTLSHNAAYTFSYLFANLEVDGNINEFSKLLSYKDIIYHIVQCGLCKCTYYISYYITINS